jgi:hypothetical protein
VTRRFYLAIDDTDNLESIGTGRLARNLAAQLEAEGLLAAPSVTRHQLLVHPDVPYTSHNSSACIEARAERDAGTKLLDAARSYLLAHFHDGANPGLCVCPADAVPAGLAELGQRAQREVLDLADFDHAVADLGLLLWCSGPTGQGRIGAASGVGLRSTGCDGRFIGLRGIRDLCGTLPVDEILARSGVARVETREGDPLAPAAPVDTRDWVRPTLRDGRPVLVVREEEDRWVPAERRSKDD